MAERDFQVSDTGEMVIRNGDFATVDSLTQEVGMLLLTNKGEIRNDLFCGCDLVRKMNGRILRSQLERIIRLQVERDGKIWADIMQGINVMTNV